MGRRRLADQKALVGKYDDAGFQFHLPNRAGDDAIEVVEVAYDGRITIKDQSTLQNLLDKSNGIKIDFPQNSTIKVGDNTYSEGTLLVSNDGSVKFTGINTAGDEALSFIEKSKLFVKGENALLRYSRKDGTFFMHKSPSNPNLTTGYSNELTFRYKSGPNANSKDVFGKIGVTDEGYIVGNLRKPTGMNNQQVKGITEDAMDMALHHFGKNNVKGIKALWVKNADLYPNMVGNKSINLSKFEKALETMDEGKAVFETITGYYAKSRSFSKVIEIKKLEESIDGVYGYEVIFGAF